MFRAAKTPVHNRGSAPDSFLNTLVEWARTAPDEIFAPRPAPAVGPDPDIYAKLRPILGPWTSLTHRKAAMLELMRVHAGLEASWNWHEAVDRSNASSLKNKRREESGVFQVSFDSLDLDHGSELQSCLTRHGVPTGHIQAFIDAMKSDRPLAMEYYARLMRINTRWAGPVNRSGQDSIWPWISRPAVQEFQAALELQSV